MSYELGRDGVVGDGDPILSELRQVTCGLVVHRAVDNRDDMRITGGILWTSCGCGKKSK